MIIESPTALIIKPFSAGRELEVLRLPEEAGRRVAAADQAEPHLHRVLRVDDGARRRLDRLLRRAGDADRPRAHAGLLP